MQHACAVAAGLQLTQQASDPHRPLCVPSRGPPPPPAPLLLGCEVLLAEAASPGGALPMAASPLGPKLRLSGLWAMPPRHWPLAPRSSSSSPAGTPCRADAPGAMLLRNAGSLRTASAAGECSWRPWPWPIDPQPACQGWRRRRLGGAATCVPTWPMWTRAPRHSDVQSRLPVCCAAICKTCYPSQAAQAQGRRARVYRASEAISACTTCTALRMAGQPRGTALGTIEACAGVSI